MKKTFDEKIGTRELVAIIMFTIGIKFKDTTPHIFYTAGQTAAWMIPLISMLILFIPFYILITLLKKHQIGLIDLFFKLLGKFFGVIICAGLFINFFAGMIFNFRGHVDIISTLIYQRTPLFILAVIMIIVCFFISYQGFSSISRTSWLIFPVFQILMLFLIFLSWKDLNWDNLFPLWGPGVRTIVKESFVHLSIVGEIMLLGVFYTYLRKDKDFLIGSFAGIGISCFQIAVFFIVMQLIFNYPFVAEMSFPYQQLTRYVMIGNFVSHIEGIFLGFWTIVTTLHFSLYLLFSATLLAGALQIKQYQFLLMPLAALVLIISLIPENVFNIITYRKIIVVTFSFISICLPILLLVVDRWKGRLQK